MNCPKTIRSPSSDDNYLFSNDELVSFFRFKGNPVPKKEFRLVEVEVFVCPQCSCDMVEEKDKYARTMWHYICSNKQCNWKY